MLNTGFTLFRNRPQVIEIVRAASDAIRTKRSFFEQTAVMEELVDRNCSWSTDDGEANPGNEKAHTLTRTKVFLGSCNGGLKVVVLPYKTITRSVSSNSAYQAETLAVHPGGSTHSKISLLPLVRASCARQARERHEI